MSRGIAHDPLREALAVEFGDVLPDWQARYDACLAYWRRQAPPNGWNAAQWNEEVAEVAAVAALEAQREFQPGPERSLGAFMWWKMRRAIKAAYQDERYEHQDSSGLVEHLLALQPDTAAAERKAALAEAVAQLAPENRELLRLLFEEGRTEEDIAGEWGVSQQAISKRKTKILLHLRRLLQES